MESVQYNSAAADIGAFNEECVLLTDLLSQLGYLPVQVLCPVCIVNFFVFQCFSYVVFVVSYFVCFTHFPVLSL
jgi:hypothetical protein